MSFTSSPYLRTNTGLFDLLCTTSFAYLMASAATAVITGSLAARIDIFGFLVPHATKVIMWSAVSLFWLRPRFGWRYPFAMFMLYCAAEMITNFIYVGAHWYNLSSVFVYNIPYVIFVLAECFFALGIILGYTILKGRFELHRDWAIFPFVLFVGMWVAMGYQTESTIANPSYWLETQEFIWNVLYLLMATQVFRVKEIVKAK
ncbi:MAG: hypothetical protein KGI38_12410 [Thaumarchaeota archaeon]|nr:hypothetical protein [Nitrososphaerota archaeon]